MSSSAFERIRAIVGSENLSTQADQLLVASRDESSHPACTPIAVVWANTAGQIEAVVRACYESRTPITTRGAGSSLEGSAIPSQGAIVLDLSHMNRVIELWEDDLQVKVEPGIIYDHLNEQLKRHGLFFPPSPGGSGDLATIGGMVSTNASGIYSVRYGGTRDYVLGIDFITGDGRAMKLGGRAIKRSSGYNLVELVAGSEGTLGVISSITLRLAGLPESRKRTAFLFPDELSAAQTVSEIRKYGLDIAAVEFLDRRIMHALNKLKSYGLPEQPALFLEFHGSDISTAASAETVAELCESHGGKALTLGEGQNPWEIRHWATESVRQFQSGLHIMRNDIAFPISRLPEMVAYCYEAAARESIQIFAFGHVGMGLLHALMLANKENAAEWHRAEQVNHRIVEKAVDLGGTVSGEHGIGLGMREQFIREHGAAVDLMRQIKSQFDPHGIMNPGKIFSYS